MNPRVVATRHRIHTHGAAGLHGRIRESGPGRGRRSGPHVGRFVEANNLLHRLQERVAHRPTDRVDDET